MKIKTYLRHYRRFLWKPLEQHEALLTVLTPGTPNREGSSPNGCMPDEVYERLRTIENMTILATAYSVSIKKRRSLEEQIATSR
jgi:hypothetical protein